MMEIKNGDVIRWFCWDGDDNTTWEMTGLVTDRGIVYLGGGVDFGMAIGRVISIDEVSNQAKANDPGMDSIMVISKASDLAIHISRIA